MRRGRDIRCPDERCRRPSLRARTETRLGPGAVVPLLTLTALLMLVDCRGESRRLEPTLASIQANVFDVHCARAGCHVMEQPDTGLVLRPGQSRRGLVNVPSLQIPERLLVIPFDAEASYLIAKLEGERIVGERMPNGTSPLPPTDIAVIREWINAGAPAE